MIGVNTNETKGLNLIQILIGDRSTTNLAFGTIWVTRPEKINDDMRAALKKWYDESLLLSFVFFTSYICTYYTAWFRSNVQTVPKQVRDVHCDPFRKLRHAPLHQHPLQLCPHQIFRDNSSLSLLLLKC